MKAFSFLKSSYGRMSIFVMFSLSMQGCIVSGLKVDKSDQGMGVDASNITGSITPTQSVASDPTEQADQFFIRDKLAALPVAKKQVGALNWDNATTGSQGIINNISDNRKNNQLCRTFEATRTAFDGMMLYHGKICEVTTGVWNVVAFEPVE